MVLALPLMEMALVEAEMAAERGEVPVGAVIADGNGQVLARAGNRTIELNDPTAHAEILAIRAACNTAGSQRLTDCIMYVTLEPCPMCASALSLARIARIYYGAEDEKSGGIDNGARVFAQSSCHHRPEVYGGIGEAKAATLLKDFFAQRR